MSSTDISAVWSYITSNEENAKNVDCFMLLCYNVRFRILINMIDAYMNIICNSMNS